MKNTITLLVIAFALKTSVAEAQIPNSGFEQLNADGTVSHWGNIYLIPVWLDSLCQSHFDSVVFDNYYYAPTSNAHWGNTALELRNAWDFTTNSGIAGAAGADEDTVFSSWGLTELVSMQTQPFNFGFFYKYFPVNGDSAVAYVAMWDSSTNIIGEGWAIITAPAANYTYIEAPIYYSAPGNVAFFSLSFSTFYSAVPGSHQPSFGTRFLVDDVSFNNVAAVSELDSRGQMKIYPNPASNQINVNTGEDKTTPYRIYNIAGGLITEGFLQPYSGSIPLNNFEDGLYIIAVNKDDSTQRHIFTVSK